MPGRVLPHLHRRSRRPLQPEVRPRRARGLSKLAEEAATVAVAVTTADFAGKLREYR